MANFNFSQSFVDNDFEPPISTSTSRTANYECVGDRCEKICDISVDTLACGHVACSDCRQLAIINNQSDEDAVRFYKQPENIDGRSTGTNTGDLGMVSTCPMNCDQAALEDTVTRVPPCSSRVQMLIIWDKIKTRVAAYQAARGKISMPFSLFHVRRPEASFKRVATDTGVQPYKIENTLHIYDTGMINTQDLTDGGINRLNLLRIRPKNFATSTHALYVWVHATQTVGKLIEELYFVRYGQRRTDLKRTWCTFLKVANSGEVFGWDEELGNVFQHNQTIFTEIEW